MRKKVTQWMRDEVTLYPNFYLDCGELNCTELAEAGAIAHKHTEWLDDADHWIWELPVELSDELEKLG